MWIILIGLLLGLAFEAYRQDKELTKYVNMHSKEQKADINNSPVN